MMTTMPKVLSTGVEIPDDGVPMNDGGFVKCAPHCRVYDGCGLVKWQNMMYSGFGPDDDCPGAIEIVDDSAQPALKPAD